MYTNLDTEKYEERNLKLSDKETQEGLQKAIQEFCFGIASFFVGFALKNQLKHRTGKRATGSMYLLHR